MQGILKMSLLVNEACSAPRHLEVSESFRAGGSPIGSRSAKRLLTSRGVGDGRRGGGVVGRQKAGV